MVTKVLFAHGLGKTRMLRPCDPLAAPRGMRCHTSTGSRHAVAHHRLRPHRLALSAVLLLAPLTVRAQIAEVQVTPENMTLNVGQREKVLAAGFDKSGNLVPASRARFAFLSSDTAVAVVTSDGTVVAVRAGTAEITARAGTKSARVQVIVSGASGATPPPVTRVDTVVIVPTNRGGRTPPTAPPVVVANVTVEPTVLRLLPLESAQLTARVTLADGSVGAVPITWTSLAPTVASVDGTGKVTGLFPGPAFVLVEAGNVKANVQIEVTAAEVALNHTDIGLEVNQVDTLALVVPSQGNRKANIRPQWFSSNPAVVKIGPDGIIQAVGSGTADVGATLIREVKTTATVYRQVENVKYLPTNKQPVLVPYKSTGSVRLVALAKDSSEIPNAKIRWSVIDTNVASYDAATGTLAGRNIGTTTLTARLRGFDPISWVINVLPSNVVLDQARVTLAVGGKATLAAQLADDEKKPLGPAKDLKWSSSRPEVADVSPDGTVTAAGIGKATITAAAPWGKSASADVFVAGDLLYSSNRGGTFALQQVLTSAPGKPLAIATEKGSAVQGRYSPDRTRVVFSGNANGTYELYTADLDGSNLQRISSGGAAGEPQWTPDGKQLIYSKSKNGEGSQIYLANADGTGEVQLTGKGERGPQLEGSNLSPVLSPDGKQVAFISNRDRNYELYVMDISGQNARRLTNSREREQFPQWTPTGELVYGAEGISSGASSEVFKLTPASGAKVLLFETKFSLQGLALSRDGATLAYIEAKVVSGKQEYFFFLRPVAAGPQAQPTSIPLQPGEQVSSPAF